MLAYTPAELATLTDREVAYIEFYADQTLIMLAQADHDCSDGGQYANCHHCTTARANLAAAQAVINQRLGA